MSGMSVCEEPDSWKPVRMASAHVVFTVIQQRFPKEQLRMVLSKVVANMLQAAAAEREEVAPCGGLPMRICHQVCRRRRPCVPVLL